MPSLYKNLSFDEVLEYLNITKNALLYLITKNHISYIQQGNSYQFNLKKLRHWQLHRLMNLSEKLSISVTKEAQLVKPKLKKNSLVSYLFPELVIYNVKSNSSTAIFRELSKYIYKNGFIDDEKIFFDQLVAREQISSTSIGNGIALPHTSTHDEYLIQKSFILIGISSSGRPFKAIDGKFVDLFILSAMDDDSLHLYVISQLVALLRYTFLADDLRKAKNYEKVVELFHISEAKLVKKYFKKK